MLTPETLAILYEFANEVSRHQIATEAAIELIPQMPITQNDSPNISCQKIIFSLNEAQW